VVNNTGKLTMNLDFAGSYGKKYDIYGLFQGC